jgi:membrane fusion protein, multidrug efflux system
MNRIELQQDGASELHGERQATLPAADQETSRAPVPVPPSSRMRIAAIVIPLLVIGGLLLGFFPRLRERRTAVADMTQLAIPTVSVVSLTPLKSGDGLILPAEIRPWREASIYARANGYLKDWKTDIGAHVQANQLLAEIETPDLDQQLDQAKAQVVLAQAKLHLAETTDVRWQTLLKTVSVSQQEADEKSAARETESAAVEAERANMRRLQQLVFFERVIAPFDGTVTRREVDIGDLIVAGSGGRELFHIAQTGKLRVYVHVPEPYALAVAPGQTARLTTPESPGQEFDAKVITTSESIATSSRTLVTELEVDNSKNQILPYSFGELSIKPNDSDPPLTLPSDVLIFRSLGLQVGVVRSDGTVELRSVKVGRDFGQNIEIVSGVTPADRVIANPTDSLVDGVKVRLQGAPGAAGAN